MGFILFVTLVIILLLNHDVKKHVLSIVNRESRLKGYNPEKMSIIDDLKWYDFTYIVFSIAVFVLVLDQIVEVFL